MRLGIVSKADSARTHSRRSRAGDAGFAFASLLSGADPVAVLRGFPSRHFSKRFANHGASGDWATPVSGLPALESSLALRGRISYSCRQTMLLQSGCNR